MFQKVNEQSRQSPSLGGGPLGYGDPDDKTLRKTEKDILIPRLMKEEATNRCSEVFKVFFDCVKEAGFVAPFKCREETKANNECLESWMTNPEFVKEMTEIYLERRSYFRRTGQPLVKYSRVKNEQKPAS